MYQPTKKSSLKINPMVSERKQPKPIIWNLAQSTDFGIVHKQLIQKQEDQTTQKNQLIMM